MASHCLGVCLHKVDERVRGLRGLPGLGPKQMYETHAEGEAEEALG